MIHQSYERPLATAIQGLNSLGAPLSHAASQGTHAHSRTLYESSHTAQHSSYK